jgi:hypothetical protein
MALFGSLTPVWIGAQGVETQPAIDPQAEEQILRWSEHEPECQFIRFEIMDTLDQVQDWGQKVMFTHLRTAALRRPDRLRLESRGDLINRDLVYDGSTVTLFDHDENAYTQVEFSGTVEEMMDMLLERYGVQTPLADLFAMDRATILDDVEAGRHIGMSRVGEHECHHLAFTQEDIDWQAWIDAGEQPIMRRLVITDKGLPSQPQYALTLLSLSTPEEIAEEEFAFEPPEGAEQIDLVPLEVLLWEEDTASAATPEPE